jgi:WD40 repeat protein
LLSVSKEESFREINGVYPPHYGPNGFDTRSEIRLWNVFERKTIFHKTYTTGYLGDKYGGNEGDVALQALWLAGVPNTPRIVYKFHSHEVLIYGRIHLSDINEQLFKDSCDAESDAALSPDGRYMAIAWTKFETPLAPLPTNITLLDIYKQKVANNAEKIPTYDFPGRQNTLLWSPDSKYIATTNGTEVYIWDVSAKKVTFTYVGHSTAVQTIAWSPDSKCIASASENQVRIWDQNNTFIFYGHKGPVLALAWSPDGTRIASSGEDQQIQIWNVRNGQIFYIYQGHVGEGKVEAIAWSPDGKYLASACNATIHIWQPTS